MVLVQMLLPMRVLVGVLAALPGYSPSVAMLFSSGTRVVVFVVAGRLGSPCAVARHGSKSLGPGVGEISSGLKTNVSLLLCFLSGLKLLTTHHSNIS